VRVKDLRAGAAGSFPDNLMVLGNTLYFVASDGAGGRELWKSDGSAAGTVRVKDINLDGDSYPSTLTVVGSTLYFSADDGSSGRELWKSDGSAIGTARVRDINPGPASSTPQDIVPALPAGRLLFTADDGVHGIELWQSDGSAIGTALVQDLAPGAVSSTPYHLTVSNGRLFFGAYTPSVGAELHMLDMADLRYMSYLALAAR
jgi:ELWxxDGT repeat protein